MTLQEMIKILMILLTLCAILPLIQCVFLIISLFRKKDEKKIITYVKKTNSQPYKKLGESTQKNEKKIKEIKMRDLEQELYEKICAGCESERKCHIECEHCDYYYEKLEELEQEQEDNEIEEEVERRMETIYSLIDAFGFTADDMADYMKEYNDIRTQFEDIIREERTNENLIKSLQSVINAERMRTASYKTKYEKSKQSLPIIKEGNKHKCPTCKAVIGKYPYCKYCGQKLGGENE